jgi:hypothetical protein
MRSRLSVPLLLGYAVWAAVIVGAHDAHAPKSLVPRTTVIGVALNTETNLYPNGIPAEQQQQLARRYPDIFRIFMKHSNTLARVKGASQ